MNDLPHLDVLFKKCRGWAEKIHEMSQSRLRVVPGTYRKPGPDIQL
jgi:hypothetical protein